MNRTCLTVGILLLIPVSGRAQHSHATTNTTGAASGIPRSLRAEHDTLHAQLLTATREPGRMGELAKKLAEVLHPHFVREEQIALPPLGVLAALARQEPLADEAKVRAMADSLRTELPRMLEEHARIRSAVEALRQAARAERSPRHERLAEQLSLHALTEEEVMYPAAILVGELLRSPAVAGPHHHCRKGQ